MVNKELKTKFFNPCSSKLDEELEDELIEEVVELEEEEEDNDEEDEELVFVLRFITYKLCGECNK